MGALALLILGIFLASLLFTDLLSPKSDTMVAKVDTPSVADAPETIANLEAKAEKQEAAQEQKTEEKEVAPPPPEDPTLYLTVPKMGIYDHTVRNDDSQWALDLGAGKIPSTGFPWEKSANTYIAGHRVGYPGTESYYQFYNLPIMLPGDAVYLTDANGTVYNYKVSEVFAVNPSDVWVSDPIVGRDMVSLQTCTETTDDWWTLGPGVFESGPTSGRLIVRADKVSVDYPA
ncbi:N/A [soil metagenome]